MEQIEVAVVGAGAAGLAAAACLRAAGVGVLVLEARPRLGGRAHTDRSRPDAPFDRGAAYIHAADQGNPWLALARGLGMAVVRDPRRRLILDGGRRLDPAPYQAAVAQAWRRLATAPAGGAAGTVLPAGGPAHIYARTLIGPWLSGVEADRLDAADFLAARDGADWLVPEGYGSLVARTGADLPVRLGCPVRALRTRADRVELDTAAGRLRAGQVVLTVPLGVLAAGAITLDPPPPARVQDALDALPMGNLIKLRARLAGDPFGCGETVYVAAPPRDEGAILWLVRPFGRDEMVGFAGGDRAAALAALAPAALRAAIGDELAALLGAAARGRLGEVELADWQADPWARGSYAFARPGAAAARAALRRPWSERVRYAGEAAAADGWHGTVAGAHLSGRAAAAQLLAARSCRGNVDDR